MVILPRKHPKPFNEDSGSVGIDLMGSNCALTRTRYLSQSEGKGRCNVPSAGGSSIAVNELIEETYFNILKKERKKSKVAEGFAITPKRRKNHKAPKQDGEIHLKVFSLEFSVFSQGKEGAEQESLSLKH